MPLQRDKLSAIGLIMTNEQKQIIDILGHHEDWERTAMKEYKLIVGDYVNHLFITMKGKIDYLSLGVKDERLTIDQAKQKIKFYYKLKNFS